MNRRFNPFPKKKSHLNSLGKTAVAARVMLDVMNEKIDQKEAGQRLRSGIGLNWSWVNMVQFLSGQEALGAWRQLPHDWSQDGLTRRDIFIAIIAAAVGVNHARPDGQRLCASYLAQDLKDVDLEKMAREIIANGETTLQ